MRGREGVRKEREGFREWEGERQKDRQTERDTDRQRQRGGVNYCPLEVLAD